MTTGFGAKSLQFVVKISKYCNLRCTYCYEYRELGNKQRMSLDQLTNLFTNVGSSEAAKNAASNTFIWHGGEPFLIPVDYYEDIRALQEGMFADRVPFTNAVQTNLTVLTERHLSFLQQGNMFDGVGVSFDVYGDQRVDKQGLLRTETVLANMQRLVDRKVPFGAISVLSRNTLAHAKAIYRFYDRLGVRSRLLPFYMSAGNEQVSMHALSYDELVTALTSVFDAWSASENATPVDPIDEYLDYAISFLSDKPKSYYDKLTNEAVYLVDVDGSVWGLADAYDPEYRLGNLFEQNLDEILDSPARHRGAIEADERMAAHCSGCPYFGHCPGHFVGDATAEQRRLLDDHGCPVRVVVDHIVQRLRTSEVGVTQEAAADQEAL